MTTDEKSFATFAFSSMALDPIHAGTGGTRLGRVDNTIVRDPVTRIPKIPGSSLAGVMRAYVTMRQENTRNPQKREKPFYPDCAGQSDGKSGHCGRADCPVCTVFGFAKGNGSGFAGLAGFSDMHVLLFPVTTREGPCWVTSPGAMRIAGRELSGVTEDIMYRQAGSSSPLNLGWLLLAVRIYDRWNDLIQTLKDLQVPEYIQKQTLLVSDKLFSHVVNSNLEVRTSVAINPATGSAEDGALFTYEALPRGTVLVWEMTCRNPKHFKINGCGITAVESLEKVRDVVADAHYYLGNLGIGGMGTRGMGRLRVLQSKEPAESVSQDNEASQ